MNAYINDIAIVLVLTIGDQTIPESLQIRKPRNRWISTRRSLVYWLGHLAW